MAKQPNGPKGLGKPGKAYKGSKKGFSLPNGEKGLGRPGGKDKGGYGANQLGGRYKRKRISTEYGGGK